MSGIRCMAILWDCREKWLGKRGQSWVRLFCALVAWHENLRSIAEQQDGGVCLVPALVVEMHLGDERAMRIVLGTDVCSKHARSNLLARCPGGSKDRLGASLGGSPNAVHIMTIEKCVLSIPTRINRLRRARIIGYLCQSK